MYEITSPTLVSLYPLSLCEKSRIALAVCFLKNFLHNQLSLIRLFYRLRYLVPFLYIIARQQNHCNQLRGVGLLFHYELELRNNIHNYQEQDHKEDGPNFKPESLR